MGCDSPCRRAVAHCKAERDSREPLVTVQVGLSENLVNHELNLVVLEVLLRVEVFCRWVAQSLHCPLQV